MNLVKRLIASVTTIVVLALVGCTSNVQVNNDKVGAEAASKADNIIGVWQITSSAKSEICDGVEGFNFDITNIEVMKCASLAFLNTVMLSEGSYIAFDQDGTYSFHQKFSLGESEKFLVDWFVYHIHNENYLHLNIGESWLVFEMVEKNNGFMLDGELISFTLERATVEDMNNSLQEYNDSIAE